ncbi:MAG: outer membrane beta-barrel domain-containing protein [Bdellovibrionaceae bacterium]|nr:outer membrane beta-barrel domain-containing protein [Bdellovibrio sp.]
MKTFISHSVLITLAATLLNISAAYGETKSLKSDFKTLGDNQEVIDRVQKLDSRQKVRVVQNRMMDRNNRVEVAMTFGALSGADAYVDTKNLGGMLQYHLTPRWSFGVGYEKAYNNLNSEGTRLYDKAANCQRTGTCNDEFPKIDSPIDTKLVSVSFYPIYGKLNMFDSGIAQFDIFTTLAYGQKTLKSGNSDVIAGSLGAGVWLNSFLTARIEGRYESYHDLLQTENRSQSGMSVIGSVGAMIW